MLHSVDLHDIDAVLNIFPAVCCVNPAARYGVKWVGLSLILSLYTVCKHQVIWHFLHPEFVFNERSTSNYLFFVNVYC